METPAHGPEFHVSYRARRILGFYDFLKNILDKARGGRGGQLQEAWSPLRRTNCLSIHNSRGWLTRPSLDCRHGFGGGIESCPAWFCVAPTFLPRLCLILGCCGAAPRSDRCPVKNGAGRMRSITRTTKKPGRRPEKPLTKIKLYGRISRLYNEKGKFPHPELW